MLFPLWALMGFILSDSTSAYCSGLLFIHSSVSVIRIMESSLRTVNNLLERLHASFFFYLLTGPGTFIVIGKYLPAAVLVGVGLELNGLDGWVGSGWEELPNDKREPAPKSVVEHGPTIGGPNKRRWRRRRRPLLMTLGVMGATHLLGYIVFLIFTSAPIVLSLEVRSTPPPGPLFL